jgi:NAD(P)-dependent dehydrogenase (short-subunit alcohol dehydrogenase family)
MGLAVATDIAKKGDWHLHLLDMNVERGKEAAKSLGPSTKFYKANVTDYASLASIFDNIFKSEGQIDFVFANAGIVERDNFYVEYPIDGPPPEPNQLSIDINLKAVVNTSYLAQHYFRRSPGKGQGTSLVMTASCGGLYPSPFCPMYSASKRACRSGL